MSRHLPWRSLAICLWLTAGGCASWHPAEDEGVSQLPASPLPADSVVLEVAFARMPLSDQAAYDEIWQHADEQAFPIEVRRELAANGLRCGILGNQLPMRLKQVLDRNASSLADQAEDAIEAESATSRADRRIQCRAGRRAKVYTSKTFDSLALLTQEQGVVRGWPLSQAQCLFGLKAYPQGDARARLDLVPEVEHGETKTQYVGREGTVMPQLARERVVLDSLKLEATLTPGHVLMISTTPEAKGLGNHFFVESSVAGPVRSLLLIRLAVTQHDDLFAPDQLSEPLATPAE